MRKLLLMMATCLLMAMTAAPAMAQGTNFTGPCAVPAEQLGVPTESFLVFIPEANGCIVAEGQADPLIAQLNGPVYDADTGENLGLLKNVDPNLADNITYEQFCGAFPTLAENQTAQNYYETTANAKEQAILDPNGDGLACTDEDAAFLAGGGMTDDAADDGVAEDGTTAPTADQYADDDEMTELPDTGGPALLLPIAGFALMALGGFFLKRRLNY